MNMRSTLQEGMNLFMDFKDNGLAAWEENAHFWDEYMGNNSNFFHCDIVRPNVEKLLEINEHDLVLDIACGNGNFSHRMAMQGAKVIAFDYSSNMIALAIKRRLDVLDKVTFRVCDATDYEQLLTLKQNKPFTKAVANMAIMDISAITPLFQAVYEMLDKGGVFVFATHHPCFTYENNDYFTSCINKGVAIEGQPMLQNYYHRSMSDILSLAFHNGFVLDGFFEVPFEGKDIPIIMTIRLRKVD